MASKWNRFKPQAAGAGGGADAAVGSLSDSEVVDGACRTPLSADTKPRSAHKAPRLGKVLGKATSGKAKMSSSKSTEIPPPVSSSPKVSRWAKFKPAGSGQLQDAGEKTPPPAPKVIVSPPVSKWARFKSNSQNSQEGPTSPVDATTKSEPCSPQKVSKWARFKPQPSTTQNVTSPPPARVAQLKRQAAVSEPKPGPYGITYGRTGSQTLPGPRIHTLKAHAANGAAPRISFRKLVKNVAHVPEVNLNPPIILPPSVHTQPAVTSNNPTTQPNSPPPRPLSARAGLLNGDKPSPGVRRKTASFSGQITDSDVMTGSPKPGDVDSYSDVCMLQVDEDMKRKLRQEIDVSMVTLLQPTEMLRSEMFLHEAARKNSVDKVRELIGQKVDVNSRNNLDRTAIQWAAANGNMEVASLLIHAGADVEAQDKYGMKALLWAAWFGHLDTIRVLVNGGANTSSVNKQGLNILHCAAQNNHVDVIHFICDSLEHFKMDDVEKNERTAVHLAAEKGHMDALEKLIEFKADIQLKDKSGQTAAHLAAMNGHEEVIKRLLLDGIEVDVRDNEGQTPLVLAAIEGHLNTVEMLLQANADPNADSTKQMTALMAASQAGKKDVVAALLEFGCNINVQNHQSNTSVHLATLGNHIEVLKLLIDAYAELNLNNKRMQTPLHAAVENGLADAVEVLLIAGADIEAKEKTGKTALQMASRGSFIGIVDMIIKAERHNQLIATDGKLSVCTGGGSEINIQFKRPNHECTEFMKDILWKMATKQLKPGDWKKLAHHWKFTDAHIKAIEHQYTGPHSYTEHGYRLLLIWLHSVKKEDSPIKHLFEALLAIDRRELAEHIRRKANVSADKSTSPKICRVS